MSDGYEDREPDERAELAAADGDEEAALRAALEAEMLREREHRPQPSEDNGEKAADAPPPGVLVVKTKDGDNIIVDVAPVGGVEPTEVLTLLELAIQAFRAKAGLPAR